jgi:hypothetical protein
MRKHQELEENALIGCLVVQQLSGMIYLVSLAFNHQELI